MLTNLLTLIVVLYWLYHSRTTLVSQGERAMVYVYYAGKRYKGTVTDRGILIGALGIILPYPEVISMAA